MPRQQSGNAGRSADAVNWAHREGACPQESDRHPMGPVAGRRFTPVLTSQQRHDQTIWKRPLCYPSREKMRGNVGRTAYGSRKRIGGASWVDRCPITGWARSCTVSMRLRRVSTGAKVSARRKDRTLRRGLTWSLVGVVKVCADCGAPRPGSECGRTDVSPVDSVSFEDRPPERAPGRGCWADLPRCGPSTGAGRRWSLSALLT